MVIKRNWPILCFFRRVLIFSYLVIHANGYTYAPTAHRTIEEYILHHDWLSLDMELRRCVGLLCRLCIVPFTTGNTYISASGQRKNDGTVSSVVIGTSLYAIVFVLLILSETESNLTVEEAKGMRGFTFSILLIFGVVSLLVVLRKLFVKVNADNERRGHLLDQKYLRLIFMWIFAVACLVDTTLHLLITFSVFNDCKSTFLWSIRVVSNSLLITFLITQTVLLSISKIHYIIAGLKLRYALVLTMLCNAAFWFYSVARESRTLDSRTANSTQTDKLRSNIFEEWSKYLAPVFVPMTVEYTLMSMFFIFELMGLENNLTDEFDASYDQIGERFAETDPILSFRTPRRLKNLLLPIIIGLVLTVPLLALDIYISLEKTITGYEPVYVVYECCWVANHATNLLVSLLGLRILAPVEFRGGNARRKSRIGDSMLLFCCLGIQMIHVFSFYGNFMSTHHLVGHMVTLRQCVGFVETIIQTMFIVQSTALISHLQRRHIEMRNLLLAICIVNFALWISDSFVKHIRVLSVQESKFYKDYYWNVVVDILYPLGIFYRFHSAFECYNLYGKV